MVKIHALSLDNPRAEEVPTSLSSREAVPMNPKILQDLESMKSLYDCNSVVSASLINHLRIKYFFPTKFHLQVLQPDQRLFDLLPRSLCLSHNFFEVRLHLPFHPMIISCLQWWKISHSQMVPNLLGYIVVFIREYWCSKITLTHKLFAAYFWLCKGRNGYYHRFKLVGALYR